MAAEFADYYDEHWSSIILAIMQFKNPLVANAHNLTQLSSQVDRVNKIFFLIDWVKPGRHHFTIEHNIGGTILDQTNYYEKRVANFMHHRMIKGDKKEQEFYVHDMLAGFRDEPIPVSFKERHTTQVSKKMFKPRKVFKDWQEDSPEVIRRALEYDTKYIHTDEIVQNDKQDAANLIR